MYEAVRRRLFRPRPNIVIFKIQKLLHQIWVQLGVISQIRFEVAILLFTQLVFIQQTNLTDLVVI